MRFASSLVCAGVALGLAMASSPAQAQEAPAASQPPTPNIKADAPARPGWTSWLNPATAPFIPVPEIAVDPDSGTTLGVLATWVQTDEQHEIRRIFAPDVLHSQYFGYGMHARVYAYPSEDEQWSIVGGIKERVEREFNAEYQKGRTREDRWSFNGSLIYDRDGTPRFFGIGNESPATDETNYVDQQQLAQAQIGFNLNHAWQILYTGREQVVDVLPGTLARIASIQTRFGRILGVGTNHLNLNRMSVVYDTRDDLTIPTHGMEWVTYAGLASRSGLFNDSMYSEAGIDGRGFWPIATNTILAAHVALRYLLSSHSVPFWALSSIGGDRSDVGGEQPLRGYGEGRFYDRDSFSTTFELRRKVASFDAVATHVDLEVTPFVDLGRVFAHTGTFPIQRLHQVYGVGFRGIARPFVVGYVDLGYGREGLAAFTGLNYPF